MRKADKRSINRLAKRIQTVFLDVDGVLTDGTVAMGSREELRFFHVRDGFAVRLARQSGLDVLLVSGKRHAAVARRARQLGVEAHQKVADKRRFVERYCKRAGVEPERCCFIGDDLVDLGAMTMVGLAMAPCDGSPEIRQAAHIVLNSAGGRGAVREGLEIILKAKGAWSHAVDYYRTH